ncbi:MAG: hypothetical protein M1822_009005 [Bathelium mastoideum]|nr:MAG: hypothetical protein M1822_009005 [Bathelium mastoideum]
MALGSPSILTLCLLLVAWLTHKLCNTLHHTVLKWRHGAKDVPKYPHKDPFLGLDIFYEYKRAFEAGRFLDCNAGQFEKYGPTFRSKRLGDSMIKTIDPEIAKAVHATYFEHFGMQPLRYQRGKRLFGNGIVIVDDPIWSHARALIRPSFDKVHVANFGRLQHHVDRFMRLLPQDQSTVDLLALLRLLVLDTSSEFIFGESMDALTQSTNQKDFLESFEYAQRGIGIRTMMGRFYHFHRDKKWLKACDDVHEYCDQHVEAALSRWRSRKQDPDEPEDASNVPTEERLHLIDEMVKETQDPIDLRYQILAVFSPAHDSTALTAGNAFFHLARHPKVWARLRAEIESTVNEPLTYELLQTYKYLDYVIKETHRLTPLATMNQRICLRTTILPRGGGPSGSSPLLIRKGDIIETNYRAMMRCPLYFGPSASSFAPERWESLRPGWAYTPFGGGPRICPAMKLLQTEVAYILVRMAREVERLECRDEEWEWREQMRLTFQSRNGVKVGLVRGKKSE